MSPQDIPAFVCLDANALVCLCEHGGERRHKIDNLISIIDKLKGRIILPTPAIAEFLARADQAGIAVLNLLQKQKHVVIGDFNLAAAFETGLMDSAALMNQGKKDGSPEPWQKVKIDRQQVAIAKSQGAKLIVSDDGGVRSNAARVGILAVTIDDLPLPDSRRQPDLLADATP